MSVMKSFLSNLAFLASILAIAVSGFTAYKVSTLEQTMKASQTHQDQTTSSAPQGNISTTMTPPQTATSPASNVGGGSPDIQPGQYLQSAWGNKGQVELLTVKRITDPETGTRDVVNIQFRIRRSPAVRDDDLNGTKTLWPENTTARNPDTSETFKAVGNKRATGNLYLYNISKGASLDAYVWLKVPETTQNLDIFIEHAQGFKNIPITGS
jgi:hypothetical protein